MRKLKGSPRNFLLVLVLVAGSLAILTRLTDYSRSTQPISYSDFIRAVEADQVKDVILAGNDVFGTLTDGRRFEAVVVDHPRNIDVLREHNVNFSVAAPNQPFSLWHFLGITILFGLIYLIWMLIRQSRGQSGPGNNIFSLGKSRAKVFMPSQVKITFNDIAGADQAKDELRDVIDFLKNPEKYKKIGAKLVRGVLLTGEPGNGKTLLAKAVAGEASCQFFSISGSDFIEVFVGVGAARIRDLFASARKSSPSIIFIDEIDAIGRQRGSGLGGGHDEREQTLNQLLIEMDGFESAHVPVIVIAATNIPEVLDKALLRPGRFDRRIMVPFPDLEARKRILSIHSSGVKLAVDTDLGKCAEDTAGFSGADLANMVNQAALIASKKGRDEVTNEDLQEAYRRILDSNQAASEGSSAGVGGVRTSSKARMFMPTQIKTTFNSVAGNREAKEELVDIIDFLKNPEKYKKLGARLTRGVLLVGDPGNGKTLLAKAVAGEANCPFFSVSASEFVEIYVGVGAARMRDLFAQARRHSPSIIFIDEIDAIGGKRFGGPGRNDEREQTLNQLLTEMDGFESDRTPIVVMAATNRDDILDSALLRPGRFDRKVVVPYPDIKSREEILRLHAKNAQIDPAVDFAKLARGTTRASGADLANLVNEAVLNAAKHNRDAATLADFEESRDKMILGKEMKSIVMSPDEKRETAYHEAGHALVLLMLPQETEPLYKVTIVPRGSALGVTHWLPERDKYSTSKEELLARITVALGGRAAEELIFNRMATGAYSDFKTATKVARSMVCDFGMSDLGPLVFEVQTEEGRQLSDATAREIDSEIKAIVERCYDRAKGILDNNRDKLETLAQALLEKETLFASEVYELLGIPPRADHRLG